MAGKDSHADVKNPTFLPVVFSSLSILMSGLILIFFRTGSFLIYVAYLFTPFCPIAGLALARSTDIKGRTNIKFDIAKSNKIVRVSGIISMVGFVVAIGVMYEIAMRHSQI